MYNEQTSAKSISTFAEKYNAEACNGRWFADADADFCIALQMQISVLLCRFGCKFLQSYADLDADSIFVYIILQYFASLCINPYNSADLDANFCVVTHILTRIYALFCGFECRFQNFYADRNNEDFRIF